MTVIVVLVVAWVYDIIQIIPSLLSASLKGSAWWPLFSFGSQMSNLDFAEREHLARVSDTCGVV